MKFAVAYCVAVILIAGASPARAQTQPFYDEATVTARCVAERKDTKDFERLGATPAQAAEMLKAWCAALATGEPEKYAALAKTWNNYAPSVRMQCIARPEVRDSEALQVCLDHLQKQGPLRGPPR